MNKKHPFIIFTLLGSLFTPTLSMAKGTEISVFTGYRSGGDLENAQTGNKASFDQTSSYGIILGFDYGPEHVLEFLYSYQDTALSNSSTINSPESLNVEVEYFQVGGSQIWTDKKIDKFFGATLGSIHLDPDVSGLSSKTHFAMSLGGGVVVKLNKNIGLRLELRGYFAALGSSEAFCIGGNCVVAGSGFMNQLDANIGVRIRF